MKKIFIVAGELSGDKTAAWYVKKMQHGQPELYFEAVGGDHLAAVGVKIIKRFEQLNVTGFMEIIAHLPRLLHFFTWLVDYIKQHQFSEVILVDFPGFNLRLAKKLQARCSDIKITYLAPPQLWCWGQWRLKKIKKYCQAVVVLYPFEVAWYAQRGLAVQWLGSPVYEELEPYFPLAEHKTWRVALIPGSRQGEIMRLLPVMVQVAKLVHKQFPQVQFVMPIAQSLPCGFIEARLARLGITLASFPLTLIFNEDEKCRALSSCCFAITKPGTVTLELGLLKVASVVVYRVAWGTYFLARLLSNVSYMALPNLFLDQEIFPEFIQGNCSINNIGAEVVRMLKQFSERAFLVQEPAFEKLRGMLKD